MIDKDKLITDLEEAISQYENDLFYGKNSSVELIKIYSKIDAYNDILQRIALRMYED